MKKVRIEIKDLSIRYRQYESASKSLKLNLLKTSNFRSVSRLALDQISLSIMQGETVGVIGKNGAGKSTLAKAIVGSVRPITGWVRTHGVLTSMIELSGGLYTDLSPRENVELHSAIYQYYGALPENRAEVVCDWAGLTHVIDQPLRTFSSGMLARFAFSLSTDIKPDILILDEILSVGDKDFQEKSLTRTRNLIATGAAVLLISHDMNTILNFCNRVIWLENGRIKQEGLPEEVVNAYLKQV